jgi:DnaK suppressor protein
MSTSTRIESARERHLRRRLQAERDRLVSAARSQRHDLQAAGESEFESVRDDFEISEADVEDDLGFTVLQLRSEMIAKIDEALARVARGEYGRCADCSCEIAVRRLEALPFAECCVSCEQERENTLSQFGRLSSAYLSEDSVEDRAGGLE